MKKIIIFISLFSVFSCSKQDETTFVSKIDTNTNNIDVNTTELELPCVQEPIPNFTSPSFDVIALHLINREFANAHSEITDATQYETLFKPYLESRLIELYPESAFVGITNLADAEYNDYLQKYSCYLQTIGEYSDSEVQMEKIVPTAANIGQVMQGMTASERTAWLDLENYATRTVKVNRTELDQILHKYNSKTAERLGFMQAAVIAAVIALVIYSVWKIHQSRNRAEDLTAAKFPNNSGGGEIGDAFRHIFVSLHLRHFITRPGAAIVMNTYERRHPNAFCGDTEMDFHNNFVGRVEKYHTLCSGNSYMTWGNNVENFVNNFSNRSFKNWIEGTTTCSTIESEASSTSDALYIVHK